MASIIEGLFAGRAGIQSQGAGIAVLSDNIANANTTGFKYSRADFADILAGNLVGNGRVVPGSGSTVLATTPILTQGSLEFTGRGLDTAIDGNGYFIVQDTGSGQRFYSRAGNFKLDNDGNLLNQNGHYVMGFPTSGAGGLQALNVNDLSVDNIETSLVTIGGNLEASSDTIAAASIPASPTDFSELADIAEHSTTFDVYDSLGAPHTVTTYFFHTGSNAWQARGYVDGSDISGGTAGEPNALFNLSMTFSANGVRTAGNPDVTDAAVTWSSGANASSIDINFDPLTQFAAPSAISSISQDGSGAGNVVGFSVQEDGTLLAQLDNGQTSGIGTVGLATFANPEALRRVGGSLFVETLASGEPVVGAANTGNFGAIESGALELSNADIATDFIKLISLQRGFQGSARVITNINDLLNEIINLA